MSFQITKREAVLVQTDQAIMLLRAHSKIHYPRAAKVPLTLAADGPAPFTIQVVAAAEYQLSQVNDAMASQAGFKNRAEFISHWNTALYGRGGINPSGDDKKNDETKVVAYRYRKADMVQKRLKLSA